MSGIGYVLSLLGEEMNAAFNKLDKDILPRICEIRIRKSGFVIVVIKSTSFFIEESGEITEHPTHRCIKTDGEYVDKLFYKMCEYSVYSKTDSIRQGFITLKNGARVGLSGTAVTDGGEIISVKDIASLSIRIPNEVKGCSISVLNCLYVNAFPSVIVAGMPGSGKTTLLRDMAYQLSSGFNDRYRKLAVVDERCEIAGNNAFFSGINADLLSSFPKAKGIETATRTLSPEMIICDEVSRMSEVSALSEAFSSGVSIALSVHIGCTEDLYKKRIIRALLETGEFSYIVLLKGTTYKSQILDAEEVYSEICRINSSDYIDERSRRFDVQRL